METQLQVMGRDAVGFDDDEIGSMDLRALGINRIVVPTKFTPLSERALAHAFALATKTGASLVVCHVCSPPTITVDIGTAIASVVPTDDELDRLARDSVLAEIAPYTLRRVPISALVRHGDPATEICGCAEELHADLIIIGSHSRGSIMRFLVRDLAETVLRKAHVPVLVLPDEHANDNGRHAAKAS